ncbi:hypothetical protein GGP41_010359 [Bipolaris sorokiniana]|uniref:Uncharacterized protein n=1 Tax=Cochliobolus sativus TaxID=45130 RepID=A0A8H5ZM60_COCSA|nr:hypothetical protein GGP41_010359 [Bipolaris sorokiniana]
MSAMGAWRAIILTPHGSHHKGWLLPCLTVFWTQQDCFIKRLFGRRSTPTTKLHQLLVNLCFFPPSPLTTPGDPLKKRPTLGLLLQVPGAKHRNQRIYILTQAVSRVGIIKRRDGHGLHEAAAIPWILNIGSPAHLLKWFPNLLVLPNH